MEKGKINKLLGIAMFVVALILIAGIVTGVTYAYFRGQDEKSGNITLSDPITLQVLAAEDDKMTAGVTITGDTDSKLVPGGQMTLRSGVKVKQGNTKVLLRALVIVNVASPAGADSTALNNAILESIFSTMNAQMDNAKWRSYEGYLYYVGDKASSTNIGTIVLPEIDSSESDQDIYLFNNRVVSLGGNVASEMNDNFQNATISITIKYQAIQSYLSGNEQNIAYVSTIMDSVFAA